jgi:DNA-binding CsgD family transcriptional regulator
MRLLATSREPLRTEGEWVYRVGGLSEVDSIHLFGERAQRANAEFALDEPMTATVAEICRRLDGMPLALELAAALVGSMTAADILERLSENLLVAGRSAVSRHRSIRAAVEWSEALLSDRERILFARLGVFVGSFDLEAAEAVVSDPAVPHAEVVQLLRGLVERSLVQFERADGRGRYRLLEIVRELALLRLQDAGELDNARHAHAGYFADVMLRNFSRIFDDEPASLVVPGLLAELGNLRAALEHSRAARSQTFARLVSGMYPVWQMVRLEEARTWLDRALAEGSPDPDTRYWLLWSVGLVAIAQGDMAAARAASHEALELCEARSDLREMSRITANLAALARITDDNETSLRLARQAVELARATDQPGRRRVLAVGLHYLAAALLATGELEAGLAAASESVAIADEIGEARLRRLTRGSLAEALRRRGDLEDALSLHRTGLGIRPIDPLRDISDLLRMAALLIALGHPDRGVKLAAAAEAAGERFGISARALPENLGVGVRETLEQATRALGRRGVSLRAAGRRISLEQAIVFATEDPRAASPGIRLSRREIEVAQHVRHGRTDPQIAKLLHIAKRTAEGHVENLRNKLGVGSRAEVAAWAAENLPDDEAAAERP